jgi:NAD(P)-dependent dehydrogenase (short-subunit alcohol dehydrogenase family)
MATEPSRAPRDPRKAGPRPPYPKQAQPPPGEERKMKPRPDYGRESYVGLGRLVDRAAVVTGGDSGIGRATALAFAREGADVVINYLPEEQADAEETRSVIEESGRAAVLCPGDVGDPDFCAVLVARAVERFGRIDLLVNNAAHQGPEVEGVEALDPERVERTFRTNVLAMFHLVREALPHMRPGASIINVASVQAYHPSPSILDYAATKGAIVAFTKGLASELTERGIRVNAVAPGPVWTPLIPQSFEAEHVAKQGSKAPLGRGAQPVEIAPAFVFLASDESRYVSGEILAVTGGTPTA